MEDTFWITNRFGEKLEALLRKQKAMAHFRRWYLFRDLA